jgi:EmrB/QacA subfamily drug resistance transporter
MSITARAAAEAAGGRLDPAVRRILTALIVGSMAPSLDTTIVTIALHRLSGALHAGIGTIQWVSTGYILALAVTIPVTGWVATRLGDRRAWLLALCLFLAGSVLCALAWNDTSLIAFRVLQGLGTGLILPLMQNIALWAGPREKGDRIVTAIGLAQTAGPVLGPVLGGLVLEWLPWRWLFLINVPLCAAGLILALRSLPTGEAGQPPRRSAGGAGPGRFDLTGFALLAPGLAGVLLGLSRLSLSGGIGRPDALGPLAGGAVLTAGFAWRGLRRRDPLVDLRLLRARSLAAASAALLAAGATMYSAVFLLSLYWQDLRGYGALHAALLLLPQGTGMLAARLVTVRLANRFGARAVTVVAAGFTAALLVPFGLTGTSTSQWLLAVILLGYGAGIGTVVIPAFTLAYREVANPRVPDATVITRIALQLGGSFGTAVAAVTLQSYLTAGNPASAYHGAFWWSIALAATTALLALALPGSLSQVPPADG